MCWKYYSSAFVFFSLDIRLPDTEQNDADDDSTINDAEQNDADDEQNDADDDSTINDAEGDDDYNHDSEAADEYDDDGKFRDLWMITKSLNIEYIWCFTLACLHYNVNGFTTFCS